MRVLLGITLLLASFSTAAESYREIQIAAYGGIENLQLVELPALPEPGPGEVRLKVLTASASFTDVMIRKGIYGLDVPLPHAPGYDLVGIIDALGSGVADLQVGQRVADLSVWGAYTEYAIRPAAGLVELPNDISDEEAVTLILSYTTAWQMLKRSAAVQPGQTVLIHGASGAVGTALAQLGQVLGLTMYGTASTAKQGYISGLGVVAIDYKTEDFVDRVMTATKGVGVDAVFDAVGADNFKRSYSVLKPNGQLVIYGLYKASLEATGMLDIIGEFLAWQWQQLRWDWFPTENRSARFYDISALHDSQPEWFTEDLSELFQMLADGKIKPQIWKVLPLAEAAQAHRHIEAGEVRGKIVLRVADQAPMPPHETESY